MKVIDGGVTAAKDFRKFQADNGGGIKYKDRTDMALIYRKSRVRRRELLQQTL